MVGAARELVADHGRDDLVAQLDRVQQRLDAPVRRVVVAGDFKQGKSTLINALVGADVCPVADDRSTATVTEVIPAPARKKVAPQLVVGDDTERLAAKQAVEAAFELPEAAGDRWWSARLAITVPGRSGPALLDLPGPHGAAGSPVLEASLPGIVAALYVSDAGAELSRTDLAGIEAITASGVPVALVVPKIDFFPAWRKVCDLDRDHLARRGLNVPVFAVSSTLHRRARDTADEELETEGGFAPLEAWMAMVASTEATDLAAAVVDDVRVALAGVRAALDAARDHGDGSGRTMADLEDRAARLHALTGERAAWRRVVADGIADLEPEGEHVIRGRLRAIRRDADAAVAQGAPADGWTRFSFWLAERTVSDIAASFAALDTHAVALSEAAGEAFEDDEATAVALDPLRPPPLDPSDLIEQASTLDAAHGSTPRRKLRRSLGRIDNAGVLEGLAMVSLNPISLAAGVLISRRAAKDARASAIESQRAAAMDAVSHYIEECDFVIRREWRAAVRRLERDLRDGYEQLASSLARSANEALASARATADDADANERIERELARIARLDEEAVAMVTEL